MYAFRTPLRNCWATSDDVAVPSFQQRISVVGENGSPPAASGLLAQPLS